MFVYELLEEQLDVASEEYKHKQIFQIEEIS